MLPDTAAFERAILADPADRALQFVYADWLDEHDDPEFAAAVRDEWFVHILAVADPGVSLRTSWEAHRRFSADVTIPSDLAESRLIPDRIEEALHACRYTDRDVFAIKLAVEEAVVNAIKHGNQMDPDKRVRIGFQVTHKRFDVRITDEGPGFNPDDVPDPTDERVLARPGGRGLLLMRGLMTEVRFHDRGNVVTMCKLRDRQPGH
jgi:serine/threonine-protein kinase RsbW